MSLPTAGQKQAALICGFTGLVAGTMLAVWFTQADWAAYQYPALSKTALISGALFSFAVTGICTTLASGNAKLTSRFCSLACIPALGLAISAGWNFFLTAH
ncbi:MAG: hypothetical protein WDN10_01330 [bacterium]